MPQRAFMAECSGAAIAAYFPHRGDGHVKTRLAWSEEWRSIVAATLESLGVAAWEWDFTSNRVWWSDNFGPLIGRSTGFVPATIDEARALFDPPPDRPTSPEELAQLAGGHGAVEVELQAMLPDGSTRWMLHRYSAILDESGVATGVFGVAIDIDDRRRREREEALLSEASQWLASSLDFDETLNTIGRLIVPDQADWCAVELLEDGRLNAVRVVHSDPERVELAPAFRNDRPHDMSAAMGAPNVVRTGIPELYPDTTDEVLSTVAGGDERALEILRNLGYGSVMVLPLTVRGERVGAITMVAAGSRPRFDERSLAFAWRLASQMAVAVDNARLHQEVESRGAQLARLHNAIVALSRALTEEEVAQLSLEAGLEASGARRGALFRVAANESTVSSLAQRGYDVAAIREWESEAAAGAGPVAAAIKNGGPVFISSPEELADAYRYPLAQGVAALGRGTAWACLPVERTDGTTDVLALSFDEALQFSAFQRRALMSLAEQTGVAMDRAHLLAHHREVALILQEGFQPATLPDIEGVSAAAVYVPSGSAEVGGDWYDLFETPAGAVVAVIGDVVGHGIAAVATMARVRHVLSAHLFAGLSPSEALKRTNEAMIALNEPEHRMATATIVAVDATRRRVVVSHAGHPPTAIRSAAGTRLLLEPRDVPLGVLDGFVWSEESIMVEPPTLLLLYTDGWIDYPGADHEDQLEAVVAVVAEAPFGAGEVIRAFQKRFEDAERADDAAALALVIL